jgi:uncharacterized protein DUF3485
MKTLSLRFVIAAALMAATAVVLQAHSRGEFFPPRQPLASLPLHFGEWAGQDFTLDQQTLDILGQGEFLLRDYQDASRPQPAIDLFIAYFPSQKAGDTIHSPNHCLPGARWSRSHAPMGLRFRSTGTWFRNKETANWCCTGFRRMAAPWPASIGPNIIW